MRLYALIGVFETRNPFLPSRFLRRLHHATGNEDSTIAGGGGLHRPGQGECDAAAIENQAYTSL
jgi:hypothetical protein